MNTLTLSQPSHSTAFLGALSPESLRQRVPAAFAPSAHESRSPSYTFIPTSAVIDALNSVGFYPAQARQAVRACSALHARHLIRFRRRFETVALRDAVPEILFLNSHDGTSAYQLRVGLYRAVCTNGLVVSVGAFPSFRVAHRGDVVANVVQAALEIGERFAVLASSVERLEGRRLDHLEQLDFATRALSLRFPGGAESGLEPARLLVPRRAEDVGNDLWRTLNVVQENVLRGGIPRRSASNRLIRTRAITAIREDIRINSGLWDLALALAA
jgi:Domain of unknown function (DUF932)